MHTIYAIARFYPFWAIPLAVIIFQIGVHFRRRARPAQWTCFAMVGVLILTGIAWLVYRGDMNSDRWVRRVQGSR